MAAPWFGRSWERHHAAWAGVGSLLLCFVYALAANRWARDSEPGWLEFLGTFTSLWSVWITQRRNVLALPIGIASVVLMGVFFHQVDLPGQTWLHLAYYLPVQFLAWSQWTRGGQEKTELVVTRLGTRSRVGTLVIFILLTVLFGKILDVMWDSPLFVYWDASVAAASVIAMALLSRKKVESWWFWILPVNVSAIGLYAISGAFMFAALYLLFLAMAMVGLKRWSRASEVRSA